jgi:hypothetical protein
MWRSATIRWAPLPATSSKYGRDPEIGSSRTTSCSPFGTDATNVWLVRSGVVPQRMLVTCTPFCVVHEIFS